MMLFIRADGMTIDEVAELRQRHDLGVSPGYVTTVEARKVEDRIVWSVRRIKKTLEQSKAQLENIVIAA
jgi:protein-L-isoaspartate O-methyltransferase